MALDLAIEIALNKIADVLQIPLKYTDGAVEGGVTATYSPLPDLQIPMMLSARKLFFHDQCGVIVHIMGGLYALVSYFAKNNAVSAFILDGSRILQDGVIMPPEMVVSKKMNLREAVEVLRPGIMQGFAWDKTTNKWLEFKLPT